MKILANCVLNKKFKFAHGRAKKWRNVGLPQENTGLNT